MTFDEANTRVALTKRCSLHQHGNGLAKDRLMDNAI